MKVERTCISCGSSFVNGEKRYGSAPYIGYYCEDCDGVDQ